MPHQIDRASSAGSVASFYRVAVPNGMDFENGHMRREYWREIADDLQLEVWHTSKQHRTAKAELERTRSPEQWKQAARQELETRIRYIETVRAWRAAQFEATL